MCSYVNYLGRYQIYLFSVYTNAVCLSIIVCQCLLPAPNVSYSYYLSTYLDQSLPVAPNYTTVGDPCIQLWICFQHFSFLWVPKAPKQIGHLQMEGYQLCNIFTVRMIVNLTNSNECRAFRPVWALKEATNFIQKN